MFEPSYPYLWASIFALLLSVILLAFFQSQRYPILISGLISASLAWCGFTLEDVYWSPSRIAGGAIGIEDFLMAFAAGGISWFLSGLHSFVSFRILSWHPKLNVPRLAGGLIAGVVLFLGLWMAGLPAMTLYLVLMCLVTACILVWRPSLWTMAMSGALGFSVFWLVIASGGFLIWPDFIATWNSASVWGQPVLGVPIGELAWAVAFGASCPLFTAFVIDARFKTVPKDD